MITAQRSDVTAKRATTEEESVPKKPRIEDEDETSMEDDDSSDSYAWEVEAKDEDEEEVRSRSSVLDMPEEEPEWDKDSYDGKECEFDPPKRFATDEDYEYYRNHKTHLWNHRGFLPDPYRGLGPILDLEDSFRNKTTREYLADVASLCVKKFNQEKFLIWKILSHSLQKSP